MYFLDNYESILKHYEKVMNTSRENPNVKNGTFFQKMSQLKEYSETLLQKSSISRSEADHLAYFYNYIFQKYYKPVEKFGSSIHVDEMAKELDAITYIDTTTKHDLHNLLLEASYDRDTATSSMDTPDSRYMADALEPELNRIRGISYNGTVKAGLNDDKKFLENLSVELENSKRNIYGNPSPQFTEMEEAFNQTKALADRILKEMENEDIVSDKKNLDDKYIQLYRKSLENLNRKALVYQTYKENSKTHLKEKEQRRVDFSKHLQEFAGSRSHKMSLNEDRRTLISNMKLKEMAYDADLNEKIRTDKVTNSYEYKKKLVYQEMKRMMDYYTRLKEFTNKTFGTMNKLEKDDWKGIFNKIFPKILRVLYGDLSDDPAVTEMKDQLLQGGKVSTDFLVSCNGAATNAMNNFPAMFGDARYMAVKTLAQKLSDTPEITGNYLFIAGMEKILLEAHEEKDKNGKKIKEREITGEALDVARGIQDCSVIVSQGISAWYHLNRGDKDRYESDLLNMVTMRTLEAEMKHFIKIRKKETDINPVFAWLGNQKDGVRSLRESIKKTKSFQNLLKRPEKEISFLLKNNDEKIEKGFEKLMTETYSQTFARYGTKPEQKEGPKALF